MEKKCSKCGAPLENGVCTYCGNVETEQTTQTYQNGAGVNRNDAGQVQAGNTYHERIVIPNVSVSVGGTRQKSWLITLLLCFFFGYFGVHRFYIGKTGSGLLYLCTMGLFGFGWIIDLILILFGTFRDSNGQLLRR